MICETYFHPTPTKCDICESDLGNVMYDSKVFGWFGCHCESCHNAGEGKIGMGHGQKYEKNAKGFLLVAGWE